MGKGLEQTFLQRGKCQKAIFNINSPLNANQTIIRHDFTPIMVATRKHNNRTQKVK